MHRQSLLTGSCVGKVRGNERVDRLASIALLAVTITMGKGDIMKRIYKQMLVGDTRIDMAWSRMTEFGIEVPVGISCMAYDSVCRLS